MCPTSIYVRQDKSMQDHELDKEQVNRHYLPFSLRVGPTQQPMLLTELLNLHCVSNAIVRSLEYTLFIPTQLLICLSLERNTLKKVWKGLRRSLE